jgi:hypothetical protein
MSLPAIVSRLSVDDLVHAVAIDPQAIKALESLTTDKTSGYVSRPTVLIQPTKQAIEQHVTFNATKQDETWGFPFANQCSQ